MTVKNMRDLVKLLTFCRNANIKEKGVLCFINAEKINLGEVAIKVAESISPEKPLPVIHLQEHGAGQLTFARIQKRARLRFNDDSSVVSEPSGLIFPQNEPLILWVDGFNHIEKHDQIRFAHLVDGEWKENGLCKGSILIAGITGGKENNRIDPGVINRGLCIDFDPD